MQRFAEEIEAELNRERAGALGRAGAKVEEHIAECGRFAELLENGDRSSDWLDRYRSARHAAEQAREALCIQREAMGLYDHAWVDRIFALPPRR